MPPLLTPSVQDSFKDSEVTLQHQQYSARGLLDFHKPAWDESGIVAQPTLAIPTHTWLKAGGHNHLRTTRII